MKRLAKWRKVQNQGSRSKPVSHFDRVAHEVEEEHPVDLCVAKRVRHRAMQKRLNRLQREVADCLGDNKRAFLALDNLRTQMRLEREEAYFNVGYEHGWVAGVSTERRGRTHLSGEAEQFVDELRARVVQSNLTLREVLLGLLECLWTVVSQRKAATEKTSHRKQLR